MTAVRWERRGVMRKCLGIFVLVLVCVSLSLPAQNNQKIFGLDSQVYSAVNYLYLEQGLALPSSAAPWSGDEIGHILARLERDALSSTGQEVYDYVVKEISPIDRKQVSDSFAASYNLDFTLEAYAHTNTQDFTTDNDWKYSFEERKPFLFGSMEMWMTDNIYALAAISIGQNRYTGNDNATVYYGEKSVTLNIDPAGSISNVSFNFPRRSFILAGGSHWNVLFGRDRLSWGNGVSGNLVIGGHTDYHDFFRFTSYHDTFKYSYLISSMVHPANFYDIAKTEVVPGQAQDYLLQGLNLFIAHRFEWTMIKDKLRLSVTEGLQYQSLDNRLDLRALSPTLLMHNFYIIRESNSTLSFELDYTPMKHLNLYGQVIVDEFRIPGEGNDNPGALGFLVGAKTAFPLMGGAFHASVEGVKTDPFLYIRDSGEYRYPPTTDTGIPLSFIMAQRALAMGGQTQYAFDFIGYEYGNDALVVNLNAGYRRYGAWYVDATFFHMWHGTFDMFTQWESSPEAGSATSPTGSHADFENNGDPNAKTNRRAVERTFLFSLQGGYTIMRGLDVYAQGDLFVISNKGNIPAATPAVDFQFTLGATYSL